MTVDLTTALTTVQSVLMAGGWFTSVRLRHPLAPPDGDLAAHVFFDEIEVNLVYAGGEDQQTHQVGIRVFQRADVAPEDEAAELSLASAVGEAISAIAADASLGTGSGVRNVDAAGETGGGVRAFWGFEEVGGTQYRTVDIVLPLIVDGSATWQA